MGPLPRQQTKINDTLTALPREFPGKLEKNMEIRFRRISRDEIADFFIDFLTDVVFVIVVASSELLSDSIRRSLKI